MKRIYVIVPIVLLVLFVVYYARFNSSHQLELVAREQAAAELRASEEARKLELEAEAAAEGRRKAGEKTRADAERKAKQREDQQRIDEEIRGDTERALADLQSTSEELDKSKARLTEVRAAREKLEKQTFELAAEVELMKIARRNAELQLQRATEMVAARAEASALVQTPLFPAAVSPPTRK